jgi:hypothetical protein
MGNLSNIGRTFYGFGIAGILVVSIYYHKLPYILGPGMIPQGFRLLHLTDWENMAKVLTLVAGALAIVKGKIGRIGAVLYALTIVYYGILHFMVAVEAASYIPSWIPYHLFWMYFCGAALIASGVAILIRTKQKLAAILLGSMILTWFIILHIPRVVVASAQGMEGELHSAFFALAYSGTAFVISGAATKK